jgi:hypothetical protein
MHRDALLSKNTNVTLHFQKISTFLQTKLAAMANPGGKRVFKGQTDIKLRTVFKISTGNSTISKDSKIQTTRLPQKTNIYKKTASSFKSYVMPSAENEEMKIHLHNCNR